MVIDSGVRCDDLHILKYAKPANGTASVVGKQNNFHICITLRAQRGRAMLAFRVAGQLINDFVITRPTSLLRPSRTFTRLPATLRAS